VTNEPDFRELIGDGGDRAELDRLRRVHELLVAAGPPPELSPALESAPDVAESKVLEFKRRRPATLLAVGIAAAAAAFVIGYAVGDRHNGFSAQFSVPMHGIAVARGADATVKVGGHDSGGNYPLEMTVKGLPHTPAGGYYELLLSKKGVPVATCGDFAVDGNVTTVRLSVPYDLPDWHRAQKYDGWVVVLHKLSARTAPIVMTT
jgi:hypothetical protein